jgi:cysteinyl-tRNA synthetase
MPLQVYSTLTRKKEPFPKKPGETVTMYVCGPTVYKPSHIGHMVGPVIFDTVKRYLTYLGYKVNWVVNITDVDDKLIVRARELGTTVKDLAEKMTADYFDCLQKLNVTGIDQFPRATEHIPGMIAMMERLIAKGYAYAAGGDVYFDISRDEDYGKLCNRDPEQLEAGSRVEVSEKKRNPGDFALWKSSKPGEPAWDSPWGKGRPGWHIECSAMAQALLGKTIDIHGGGLDLQFPHHENELAQSESDTGVPFARVWMHNGLLKMRSGKMAGSIGNVLNVVDALKLVSGDALRFFILNTHYRSPIDLGDWEPKPGAIPSGLESAKSAFETFVRFAERFRRITKADFYTKLEAVHTAAEAMARQQAMFDPDPVSKHERSGATGDRVFHDPKLGEFLIRFRDYMDDDFNTGGATAVLFELASHLNRLADAAKLDEAKTPDGIQKILFVEGASLLKELGNILGLFWQPPPKAELASGSELVAGLVKLLIDLRNNLRAEAKKIAAKDDPTRKALFEQTDVIRKRLAELGVTLEDRPGGTDWRIG